MQCVAKLRCLVHQALSDDRPIGRRPAPRVRIPSPNRQRVFLPATGGKQPRACQHIAVDDTWGLNQTSGLRQRVRSALTPVEDRFGIVLGYRARIRDRRQAASPGVRADRASALPATDSDDQPIFVLGATWRSGSTLLQRLLLSSGDIMMWGEPWNRSDLVPRLRESLLPLDGSWPLDHMLVENQDPQTPLHQQMVPDLFPSLTDLAAAHRALFDRLYREPATRLGYSRWGFKETRLGANDARYLHQLYPQARMILLIRDPYHSWASYLALRAQGYWRWPDQSIVSPRHFGTMWAEQVAGFLDYPPELPHLVVRYEDLVPDNPVIDRLASFCGVEPDRATLQTRVGRSHDTRLASSGASVIERAVEPLASALGYVNPV